MNVSRILILGLGLVSLASFQPAFAQEAQPQSVQRQVAAQSATAQAQLPQSEGESAAWRGIVADVLGVPARHSAGDANLGSAIVLAVGLGLEADLESAARALLGPADTIPVTPESADAYETAYAAYRDAASRLTAAAG